MNEESEKRHAADTDDLLRGVSVNLVGNVLKLVQPVLLVLVVRAYGAELFGLFVFAQAVVLVTSRVCLLGLDKGILWWVPRQPSDSKLLGFKPALFSATLMVLLIAPLMALSTNETTIRWIGGGAENVFPLQLLFGAVILIVWLELVVNLAMGRRRMETQVFVKETLVPTALVGLALLFKWGGVTHGGLELAFICAHALGLVVAVVLCRRLYRDSAWPAGETLRVPAALRSYSWPIWATEISNTVLLRLDYFMVSFLLSDPAKLGVYGAAVNISTAVRAIRRSFDPIVLTIVSEIGQAKDTPRLRSAFTTATSLMTLAQVPVFMFLLLFTSDIVLFFGDDFGPAAMPVLIMCAFWLVCSPANLSGIVVAGYGYSTVTLYSVFLTLAVQAACAWVLIPPFGTVGAAFSVGLSYSAQAVYQVLFMYKITGMWGLGGAAWKPLRLGLVAGALPLGLLVFVAVRGNTPDYWLWWRAFAFAVFAAVYAIGARKLWPRTAKVVASAEMNL